MENVVYQSENGVSYVKLNRPHVYNAMDENMLQELLAVIQTIEASTDRFVIVHGAGDAFSAGGDVSMMQANQSDSKMAELMDVINEIVLRWYTLDKFVLSAIHGSAAGLGLSLALNADIVLAKEETKLGMLFAGVGLIPDGGGHFFLQERMGIHQAKQFIWSMKQVEAKKAYQMGLIDRVVERDVLQAAEVLAKEMEHLPFEAAIATKCLYHTEQKPLLKQILAKEKQTQIQLARTVDHQEGVAAFIDKRRPHFNKR